MNKKRIFKIITFTTISITAANKFVSIMSNLNNCFNKNDYLTYKSQFGNVKYRKKGNGSPILLIHNLSAGDNLNEWNYVITHLTDKHTVYTLNLPGCGNSDKSHLLYTNFMYVKLVIDFINNVIGSKTDVVTSGCSNRIAAMTELYNPNVINNIIMINPSEPQVNKYNHIIGKVINFPILGTFIYNCIYSKKHCLKNSENNFRLREYMNTYYDSIHYKDFKSKYLYTSIIMGKTYINYKHIMNNIKKETYTYNDKLHPYPHIEIPEKISAYILSIIDN